MLGRSNSKTSQETVTDFGQLEQGLVWDNNQLSLKAHDSFDAAEPGTIRNPIIVSTAAELEAIGNDSDTLNRHYALDSDINYTSEGTKTGPLIPGEFLGTFDGRGHKIHAITMTNASNVALGVFENLGQSAVIRRLRIEDSTFDSGIGTGGDVGPFCTDNMHGLIEDCISLNNTLEGDRVGGICAEIDSTGTILRCFAANIYTDISGQTVGGIVGEENGDGTDDRVIDSYFDFEYSKNNGGEASQDVPVGTGSSAVSLTTSQAQTRASYFTYAGATQATIEFLITQPGANGFTFGNPWHIADGSGYPQLIAVDA